MLVKSLKLVYLFVQAMQRIEKRVVCLKKKNELSNQHNKWKNASGHHFPKAVMKKCIETIGIFPNICR